MAVVAQPPRVFTSLEEARGCCEGRPLHLAIGMFDGVHLGHRAVIEAAVRSARRCGGVAAVLTFSPHPSRLFRPADPVRLLIDDSLKTRLLLELGLDAVIAQPFDTAFAAIEAEDLLPHLKTRLRGLAAVYVGENWRFGRGRRGDIQLLVSEARRHGIHVVSAPRINQDGEPISSTRIRGCLVAGQIEDANALLGYTYFTEGVVKPGKRLGRTLGFPTLNVPCDPDLRPRLGVYAVRLGPLGAAARLSAVANYGLRPTVEQTQLPRLEVHVLGEIGDLDAGAEVRIEWLAFLREEKTFADLTALRTAIAADAEAARLFFARFQS